MMALLSAYAYQACSPAEDLQTYQGRDQRFTRRARKQEKKEMFGMVKRT